MASLPVMGLWANNHLGERGLFAYLSSSLVLPKNYVPFADETEAAYDEGGWLAEGIQLELLEPTEYEIIQER